MLRLLFRNLFFTLAAWLILQMPVFAAEPLAATFQKLVQHAPVAAALQALKQHDEATLREQIAITQIPAPGFDEAERAADFAQRLRASGLQEVTIDATGNVIAKLPGLRRRPLLVLSAHLDTVFPRETNVTVRQEKDRYFAPGIGDDARGLAVLLTLIRVLESERIKTIGDVWFVATVGEEGLGNLRGAKALFAQHPGIDGFISVDGLNSPSVKLPLRTDIVTQATGSRRWQLTFTGPGGHSYDAFGTPSAVHAMGRAIAHIAELRTTESPKSTFTVGVVSGGTAVNAIAAEAQMQVDIRSTENKALLELEQKILAAAHRAVAEENQRWNAQSIQLTSKLSGDRPAGQTKNDTPIVQAAVQALRALAQPEPNLTAASTDSNVPISLGIPAITINGGGIGYQAHSLQEWYSPVEAWVGPQHVLLTTLALLGVDSLIEPVLPARHICHACQ